MQKMLSNQLILWMSVVALSSCPPSPYGNGSGNELFFPTFTSQEVAILIRAPSLVAVPHMSKSYTRKGY